MSADRNMYNIVAHITKKNERNLEKKVIVTSAASHALIFTPPLALTRYCIIFRNKNK